MVKPASLSRSALPLTCLALILGGTVASAQQARPADDSRAESEEAVFIPIEYRPPPWQVSVGIRLSGKAKVSFSKLGALPTNAAGSYQDANGKIVARYYDDGAVLPDTTYALDAEDKATVKVEPTDGKTNYWSFTNANQVVDRNGSKVLAMHQYSVQSNGDQAEAEDNGSPGLDIEVSRELGANKRMSWGVLLGAGINDINCKSQGEVKSRLHTLTDYYSLEGINFPATLTDADMNHQGNRQYYLTQTIAGENGYSETVYVYGPDGKRVKVWGIPVEQRLPTDPIPDSQTSESEATPSITVDGYWQVKGAYMTARLGPYFTFQLTRRIAVKASAGLTFTVLGTKFLINERATLEVPAAKLYLAINNEKANIDPTVTGSLGYFFAGELDAFLTDRTGMFVGVSHENYGRNLTMKTPYGQQADISLSTGTILRTGVTTRF